MTLLESMIKCVKINLYKLNSQSQEIMKDIDKSLLLFRLNNAANI